MATPPKKSSKTTKKTAAKKADSPKKKSAPASSARNKKSGAAKKPVNKKMKNEPAAKKTAITRSSSKKAASRSKSTKTAETSPAKSTAKSRSSRSRTRKLRYKKGQEIVYPLQGVGQIQSIEERIFRSTKLLYYIIYLEVSDMTIMVPVDKADELGIRPIVDKRQANKALKLISEDYEPVPTDWKARYQNNLDLLKKGSVLDIATVVRALYHRSRIKELPILERKLYDSALKLLVDEISFSLQKGKEEVEELVLSKMDVN
jgi:CarD family transcriptional regulator